MHRVVVLVPMRPSLNPLLQERCWQLAHSLVGGCPHLDLTFVFDCQRETKQESDYTPWSKVTRCRNRMTKTIDTQAFDYVAWIDADVVDYPPDILARLIHVNPNGVTAPMVLVENSDRFYDTAAFIVFGTCHRDPNNRAFLSGRNLTHTPPYWSGEPSTDVVQMDCVGTFYVCPAAVYRDGLQHTDHPSFTDHFVLCAKARADLMPVVVDRRLTVYHADLGSDRYEGESWHK